MSTLNKQLFIIAIVFVLNVIVSAQNLLGAGSHNDTSTSTGFAVRCINLGSPTTIYSELLLDDVLLGSDMLDGINRYLPVNRDHDDKLNLKLCVYVQSIDDSDSKINLSQVNFQEKVKTVSGANEYANKYNSMASADALSTTNGKEGSGISHSQASDHNTAQDASEPVLSAVIETVYVNSLADSVANVSACVAATSLSGTCNIRSAVAFCTSVLTTGVQCIIQLPLSETVYINPSLGDIVVENVTGSLEFNGNNCTVSSTTGSTARARFLTVQNTKKELNLIIRTLTVELFGGSLIDGGALFASDLASLTVEDVTFVNTYGRNGGSVFLADMDAVTIANCSFTDTSGSQGGAIYIDKFSTYVSITHCIFNKLTSIGDGGGAIFVNAHNHGVTLSVCTFTDITAANGGAIYVSQSNSDLTISDCIFVDISAETFGGAIYIDDSNAVTISNCLFKNMWASAGGAIFVDVNNFDLVISGCFFLNGVAGYGGAIYSFRFNINTVISNCTFTALLATHGGTIYSYEFNREMKLSNCVFTNSSSILGGGAMEFVYNNVDVVIADCVFENTESGRGSYGGSVYIYIQNYNLQIRDSTFKDCHADYGGAVLSYVANSHLNITNCEFASTTARVQGGAIYLGFNNQYVLLTHLNFTKCGAAYGGAIYVASENENMFLRHISLIGNAATSDGGALLIRDTNPGVTVMHVSFVSNTAGMYGGAVAVTSSNSGILFEGCEFNNNSAIQGGGAIHSTSANSDFTLRGCTLNDNSASYGGGLFFGSDHIGIELQRVLVRTSTANYGGGIYFDTFSTEISLIETVVEGNIAMVQGGAVYTTADDMLMRRCRVLNNVAATGGGVFYLSELLIGQVNISSCLFDGNSASGLYGGVYVELASSVSIDSSNFSSNEASFGSALGAKGILDVDIQHCSFVENSASNSSGALYLEDGDSIFVTDSLFDGNTAHTGSGSAVWLSSSSDVTIQGNQFVRNSAINGGGAVYWLVSSDMGVPLGLESLQSDAMSGNYYEKNQAMYGNNVSTDAFALILSDENNYKVTDYDGPVSPIEVDLVDYYGQIVVIESAGVAVASVLTTATCFQSAGYVTGGFIESSIAGVFNFSTLNVYCDPGYSMSVNISSLNSGVKSAYFTLTFRSCVRGEYYEESVCKPCEAGTYSLTDPSTKKLSDLSNSDVCKPCPSNAKNCHGDSIELKKGYWRICDNTTTLLACPYGEQACRGGIGSGDALCMDGYEGPLCAVCSDGFVFESITQQCEACSTSSVINVNNVLLLLLLVIIVIVAVYLYSRNVKSTADLYVVIFTKLGVVDSMSPHKKQQARFMARRCKSALKIYVTLWQIVSIMPFALNLRFPDAYTAIVSVLNAVNIDVGRSSLVSCTSGHSYDAIDSLVVDTTYPMVVAVIIWLAHLLHLYLTQNSNVSSAAVVKANYHKAFLVFTYLILPSTAAKIFQVFSCQDVDPDDDVSGDDEYMTVDYSVSCSSSKYLFGFAWAIASILVYPIGVPAYYFYVLFSNKESIQCREDVAIKTVQTPSTSDHVSPRLKPILLLFEAYEPKYWYWEVVETTRRLMLTGVLVLIAQGSAVQILVGICLSLFFLTLYDSYPPFADPIVGRLEAVAQRQILSVFSLALLVKANFGSVSIVALDVFLILAIFANIIFTLYNLAVWRYTVNQLAPTRPQNDSESFLSPFSFRESEMCDVSRDSVGISMRREPEPQDEK